MSALRDRTRWEVIDVDAVANFDDLRTYLRQRMNWDEMLRNALSRRRIDHEWFVTTLARQCGGVWIYARYVLDDTRAGQASVDVAALPPGLKGFYLNHISRWSGQLDWDTLGRPCLAMLAALLRPVDRHELSELLQLPDPSGSSLRTWLDHLLRPFLATSTSNGRRRYVIRHQSLRDLFTGHDTGRAPEHNAGLREDLRDAICEAHARIVETWRPAPGGWGAVDGYVRTLLPFHAQAAGRLDSLVTDPSFLLAVDPAALLRHSEHVREPAARCAMNAFKLAIRSWTSSGPSLLRAR